MTGSISILPKILAPAAYPIQTIGALGMFAVIWAVQLIIYPSFREITDRDWQNFHQRHCHRMGCIVGPLMCAELLGGIAIIATRPINSYSAAMLTTCILTWLSTAFIFVPLHRKLAKSHDPEVIRKLISLNWVRTILWSTAAILWTTKYFHSPTAA